MNRTDTTDRFSQKVFSPALVVKNKDDQIILLVEVKNLSTASLEQEKLFDYMRGFAPPIYFGMLADSQKIQIFKREEEDKPELILELKTAEILSHYEPEFTSKSIYITYLTSLIGSWLRDLAYHWNSEFPPAWQEMEGIGLLSQLAEGTTEEL